MADTKNPILSVNCDPCEVPTPQEPTPCVEPAVVDLTVKKLPEPDCGSCEDTIVPAAPVIEDISVTKKCFAPDPAYEYLPANSCIDGTPHMFYTLHPGCSRPVQQDNFCAEENRCDEDLGLRKEYGNDNVWYVEANTAVQKLFFFVADGYEERVLTEIGYIKVAQAGNHNEWMPRDCVEESFNMTASQPFPASQRQFLSEYPNTGTIPTVVTEEDVISVVGDDDQDGIINQIETLTSDTDSDGVLDFQDTDSDSDGISDSLEGGVLDTDSDGTLDFQDNA